MRMPEASVRQGEPAQLLTQIKSSKPKRRFFDVDRTQAPPRSGPLALTLEQDRSEALLRCTNRGREMPHTWYVTFEVRKRGLLPKRRSPRVTKTFETETEAKDFAHARFNEGLVVFAGTINPYLPKRLIPSSDIPIWLEGSQGPAKPDDAHDREK
jgi:hypothetical protein